jgi:hypothetical protein
MDRGLSWPFMMPTMTDAAQLHLETWFKEQAALLGEMQKAWTAWLTRRQEAMEATSRTFQMMLGCRDIDAMAAAYGDWLTGSMDRLVADISDAREEGLRLADFGQKSLAALMAQGARATAIASPTPTPRKTRRVRGTAQPETAHEAGEQEAAE